MNLLATTAPKAKLTNSAAMKKSAKKKKIKLIDGWTDTPPSPMAPLPVFTARLKAGMDPKKIRWRKAHNMVKRVSPPELKLVYSWEYSKNGRTHWHTTLKKGDMLRRLLLSIEDSRPVVLVNLNII